MLSIKILATILLIGHIGSVLYISLVIKIQWRLLRMSIAKKLRHFRIVLFILSLVILIGNFIPIIIDVLTLFVNIGRPAHVRAASIAYALSNALIELVSAYLIWVLYRLANDPNDTTDYTQTTVDIADPQHEG